MSKYLYTITATDDKLVAKVKTEGNILLSSALVKYGSDSNKFKTIEHDIDNIIAIISRLIAYRITENEDITNVLSNVINFVNTGLLSPLTLEDKEFEDIETNDHYVYAENKRYTYIVRGTSIYDSNLPIIYINHAAFKTDIKNLYNHNENKQIEIFDGYINLFSPHLYITKGGVITSNYIKYCHIGLNKKPYDYLSKPIIIPVSCIHYDNTTIYTVDSREPMLKELYSKYNIELGFNDDIKSKGLDIRKYTKLNKQ